jgi:Protein of unknown function (DUF3987)
MSAASSGAAHAICDVCGIAPCETPGFCEASRRAERARAKDEASKCEPPRPLIRELPPADLFPVEALGDVLASAARAIHDTIQAPLAICGQSVLAAATLAVQGHADIELPISNGRCKPLSNYFVTVAATGERKSAVDEEALWPVRRRETALREAHRADEVVYENAREAWDAARKAGVKKHEGDRTAIKQTLDALGPTPLPPLKPVLMCDEPTYEGLFKLLAVGQPSGGIFAHEGGQFIGGHGMSDEAKLRTAAGLSSLWDRGTCNRVRGGDGATVLPGRRVAMHLMAQPDVAAIWFSDRLLIDQGLLSRVLATAPEPASGTRMHHEPSPESDATLKRYGARLLSILERPLPLATGTLNELAPRKLPLSADARCMSIAFADHVEARLGAGGELEPVRGLANKLPEHAARIAAVLTLINDSEAGDVAAAEMEAGISLGQHYVAEAMRLFGASCVSDDLREAQQLLIWLQTSWREPLVSLPDIYQRGPNSIRDKASACRAVTLLVEHGWLAQVHGCEVDGIFRREVWRIVKG